jgi:hypothetical protein
MCDDTATGDRPPNGASADQRGREPGRWLAFSNPFGSQNINCDMRLTCKEHAP